MVKCGVLFEVRTEFLNIIQTSLHIILLYCYYSKCIQIFNKAYGAHVRESYGLLYSFVCRTAG
jgi:hypothetical protein